MVEEAGLRFVFRGPLLGQLRSGLACRLAVEQTFNKKGCVCCAPAHTVKGVEALREARWYSLGGKEEYSKSCVCERCFDSLFAGCCGDASSCGKLTPCGAALVRLWVAARKARDSLVIPAPLAEEIMAMLHGMVPWPLVWHAGDSSDL